MSSYNCCKPLVLTKRSSRFSRNFNLKKNKEAEIHRETFNVHIFDKKFSQKYE